MRIALFFGSFNPVHTGHLIIASAIAELKAVEQVWFVVSPQNPLKPAKSLLNEYQRLHLTRLAIEGDIRFRISDVEFKLPKPSYTIDTLTYLQEKYPQHTFLLVIGSDSYQNLHKWKNAQLILQSFDILVYNRPGFVVEKPEARVTLVDAPLLDISATMIRNLLKENKTIRYYVPESVRVEIENGNYYK